MNDDNDDGHTEDNDLYLKFLWNIGVTYINFDAESKSDIRILVANTRIKTCTCKFYLHIWYSTITWIKSSMTATWKIIMKFTMNPRRVVNKFSHLPWILHLTSKSINLIRALITALIIYMYIHVHYIWTDLSH
jgi:pentose-5-phosphate-3-epimerase